VRYNRSTEKLRVLLTRSLVSFFLHFCEKSGTAKKMGYQILGDKYLISHACSISAVFSRRHDFRIFRSA
jgi:hypothetical protein